MQKVKCKKSKHRKVKFLKSKVYNVKQKKSNHQMRKKTNHKKSKNKKPNCIRSKSKASRPSYTLQHMSDSGAQQQAIGAYNRSVEPEKATAPKPSRHVPKPRQGRKKSEIPWSKELEAAPGE